MSDWLDEINYDKLINKHLRGVIVDALKIAQEQGLPGENHFYITFKTDFAGTDIPEMLKIQYPESMTIVLQHQFSDLTVNDDNFSVVLTFGGIPYKLTIPFQSITYFADPHARFGLSFNNQTDEEDSKLENLEREMNQSSQATPAEVISIDSFRKK